MWSSWESGIVLEALGILAFCQTASLVEFRLADPQIKGGLLWHVIATGEYPRARVSGTVMPAKEGIHVWILREHLSDRPGRFHVGEEPALTDKNGEWQQLTNLWRGGTFRIHAVVALPAAEALFVYYRKAFEQARGIYREKTDKQASSFPGWVFLDSLPPGSISDHQSIVV